MFKQKSDTVDKADAATPPDAVRQARTKARQRLIGAVVLLGIGVIALPLVFESKPRPISIDVPIDVAGKNPATSIAAPLEPSAAVASRTSAPTPVASAAVGPGTVAALGRDAARDEVITESRGDAGRDVTPRPARPVPAVPAPTAPAPKVASVQPRPTAPTRKPPENAARSTSEAARARALLEGRGVAAADSGTSTGATSGANAAATAPTAAGQRFIVQVGAFADAAAARETRQKVEKLGLKTYTQVAKTASGTRIRVRVGPFASRDAADAALAKAKSAGLSAVVMTL